MEKVLNLIRWSDKGTTTRNELAWFLCFSLIFGCAIGFIECFIFDFRENPEEYSSVPPLILLVNFVISTPLFISLMFMYARRWREIYGINSLENMPNLKRLKIIFIILIANMLLLSNVFFLLKKRRNEDGEIDMTDKIDTFPAIVFIIGHAIFYLYLFYLLLLYLFLLCLFILQLVIL